MSAGIPGLGAPPRSDSPPPPQQPPPKESSSAPVGRDRPFGASRALFLALTILYALLQSLISSVDTSPALDLLGREGLLRKVGQTATNFAHVVLFAGFAALAFFAIAPNGRRDLTGLRGPVLTLAAAFSFGFVDELHQAFVPGRFPSIVDVGSDVVGAALALAFLGAFPGRRAALVVPLVGAGVVLSAVAALGNDPGVVPFRRISDLARGYPGREWSAALDDARHWRRNMPEPSLKAVPVAAASGGFELSIHFPAGPWPGIVTRSAPFDWTGYGTLEVTMRNDSGRGARLGVRVDDLADRNHEEEFDLGTGEASIAVPLEPYARKVDMTRVDTLLIFLAGNDAPRDLVLTRLELRK